MTVYLDLLFIDNFCADAALLYCAVRTVKGEAKFWRIALTALAGAVLGTGYAVFRLYYILPVPLDLFIKYAVAALLPLTAAKFQKKSSYALCSFAFLAYMFAFAGALTALFSRYTAGGEDALVYTVGALPSGVLVLGSVAFAFGAVRLVRAVAGKSRAAALTCRCVIFFRGKKFDARGFADTGNRLTTRSGVPVAVASRRLVFRLLEDGLLSSDTRGEKISVRTVNGRSEMTVFPVEKIEIYCGDKVNILENVAVGIGPGRLGEHDLILPSCAAAQEKESGRKK